MKMTIFDTIKAKLDVLPLDGNLDEIVTAAEQAGLSVIHVDAGVCTEVVNKGQAGFRVIAGTGRVKLGTCSSKYVPGEQAVSAHNTNYKFIADEPTTVVIATAEQSYKK